MFWGEVTNLFWKTNQLATVFIVYLILKNKLMQCINLSGGWNQESILFFLILKCDHFSFGWDLIGNNASFAYNNQSTICTMAPHDCNCQPESFSFSRVGLGYCCFNLAGITAFKQANLRESNKNSGSIVVKVSHSENGQ